MLECKSIIPPRKKIPQPNKCEPLPLGALFAGPSVLPAVCMPARLSDLPAHVHACARVLHIHMSNARLCTHVQGFFAHTCPYTYFCTRAWVFAYMCPYTCLHTVQGFFAYIVMIDLTKPVYTEQMEGGFRLWRTQVHIYMHADAHGRIFFLRARTNVCMQARKHEGSQSTSL